MIKPVLQIQHEQKAQLQNAYIHIKSNLQYFMQSLQQHYHDALQLFQKQSHTYICNNSNDKKQNQIQQPSQVYLNIGIIKQITHHLQNLKITIDLAKQSGNIYTIPSYLISSLNQQNIQIFDIQKFISSISNHNQITLNKNQLKDSYIQRITQEFPQLYVLELKSQSFSSRKIDDQDITKLLHFTNLSTLSIRFSFVIDQSIQFLASPQFPHLKSIDLSGCQLITDSSLTYLTGDKFLTIKLNYINTITQNKILDLISQSHNLNYLQINNCKQLQYLQLPILIADIYNRDTSSFKWINVSSNMGIDLYINRLSYLTTTNSNDTPTDQDVITLLGDNLDLQGIYFNSCQTLTSDTLQMFINKCNKLKRLKICKFYQLNDSIMKAFSQNLKSLEYIDISKCYTITDQSLFHIGDNLIKLKGIILQQCRSISDQGVIHLCNTNPNINILNLYNCNRITDQSIIKVAQNMKQLKSLNLSYCQQVSDNSIIHISQKLHHLQSVILNYCGGLTDSSISLLAVRLKNLKKIQIQWCPVSQKCIQYIVNISALTSLNLSYCPSVCDQEALIMSKKLNNLTSLKLNSCDKLSTQSLLNLGKSFNSLKQLSLKQSKSLDDSCVKNFVSNSNSILFLDLSWCPKITNKSLFSIAQHLPYLQHLNLTGCSLINDEGIIWLASAAKQTQYLNLTLCQNLSDDSIVAITKHMNKLKALYLSELKKLSDISMSLLSNLRTLSELHLSGCIQISSNSLSPLLHNLCDLTYLNINKCELINSNCLNMIGKTMKNLRVLQVSQLNVNDQFLRLVGFNLNKLTFINLSFCLNISDNAVIGLLQSIPNLLRIDLKSTNLMEKTKKLVFHSLTLRKMHKIINN